ncbi:hypothetical protein ACFX1T_025324 [Malus domestica]
MGKSTILESLMRFCGAIEYIYIVECLRRPTEMDLQRLLKKGEMVPRAQNDLNVLAQSPVFIDVLQEKEPKVKWSSFVKTVPRQRSAKEKHFAICQEGCKKDVEHCFGILQARWAIVRGAARMFDLESLRSIMMMCIILHNMIVEDKYDYDVVDEYEPDTMNNSRTQIYYAHDVTEEPVQHEPLERDGRYNERLIQ